MDVMEEMEELNLKETPALTSIDSAESSDSVVSSASATEKVIGPERPPDEGDDDDDLPDWWEEMGKHPFFARKGQVPAPDEMTPEWEALVALKYDDEDAYDLAETYKKDGNMYFKVKKYQSAIDHYTAGIQAKCGCSKLSCILFQNRATCHWYLKNYRSCLRDCLTARKFNPEHMKAIIRGIQCLLSLNLPVVALKWCEDGLKIESSNNTVLELRSNAEQLKKSVDRDRRKEKLKTKRREKQENALIDALKERGVKFEEFDTLTSTKLHKLDPVHPGGGRVVLDENGVLNWPVMFVYPEFNDMDFIQAFNENSCLADHMETMFGPESCPPPWDLDRTYTPETVQVYFEEREDKKLHLVKQKSTLKDVLQHKKYKVACGTPSFVILRKGSGYAQHFLEKYS